ncbi:polysaccharide pyruvyl transferase family protein [Microbacterium sp. ABRD28]|uniref:polysaccharide pyruvyl transferase family protein n=1 Tax=Microbacterium sp. ABRD28 TaxID=2268461 RepID=UPI000F54F792|nr:polysaccharide pyruvyl transferase family protein [Microbacterium sp. ABRD28]AZC12367.1 hypothetical protein DT073_00330 [Microbacterium sp. ABRD28]
MRYLILHAYSSTNSGDGLLVKEALALIRSVDPEGAIAVLALDPDSFSDTAGASFVHPLTGQNRTPSSITMLAHGGLALLRGLRLPKDVESMVENADVAIGVGGGYMRGANLIEAIKMTLAHLPQLASANRREKDSVYLPQSVGALRWGTRSAVIAHATSITWHVRDDRSFALLDGVAQVRRTPDTAVLPLGAEVLGAASPGPHLTQTPAYGLVARSLRSTRQRIRDYVAGLQAIQSELEAELLLQASSRGNNDDRFYASAFKRHATRTLVEGTSRGTDRRSVVVSVRLHGAIQSIRNGVPAIHLSYERKGWGAFEDLGIADYVYNAFDFDAARVIEQAKHLAADPTSYWNAIARARPNIENARTRLIEDICGRGSRNLSVR